MTTNLIVPATEYTDLNAVKANVAAEAAEAAYMESMGFVLEGEGEEVSLYAGEGRKMGFLAAAARAVESTK